MRLAHHHRPVHRPIAHRGRPAWQRGVALVELALVLVPLVMIVLTAIDLAHYAKFQNRLTASAREGAAIAQYYPGWVGPGTSSSCVSAGSGGRNAYDRALSQDPDLAGYANYSIVVRKYGTETPYPPGCRNGMPNGLKPGDKIEVVVSARFNTISPLAKMWWGSSLVLRRSAVAAVMGGVS